MESSTRQMMIQMATMLVIAIAINSFRQSDKPVVTPVDDDLDDIQSCDPAATFPVVCTSLGKLRGSSLLSREGGRYYEYRGIPYSKPPKRFEVSVASQPWNLMLDARKYGAICPQQGSDGVFKGDENCLFLNVATPYPDRRCGRQMPVIVYIHGGGYTEGAGSKYDGKYFLDECIVLVTLNYRLGALGFLTTDSCEIQGNLGLKDQVLALKFVQDHISNFGGNPDLVTIMGESAGSASVSHLTLSPMAKGLFHRAIGHSGVALNPWAISRSPLQKAQQFALKLGCPSDSESDLKKCLEAKSVQSIVENQGGELLGSVPFVPVVEKCSNGDMFQDTNPAIRLTNGDFNKVPLITIFTQDEGLALMAAPICLNSSLAKSIDVKWEVLAPILFNYDQLGLSWEEVEQVSDELKSFYFNDGPIDCQLGRQNLTNLFSDRNFVQGTFDLVELYSKFADVYPAVLTYKEGDSIATYLGYELPEVTHTDDLQWFFKRPAPFREFDLNSRQYQFSRHLIDLWVKFALTGKPGGSAGSWETSKGTGNSDWFRLDMPMGNYKNYLDDRRKFWKSLSIYRKEFPL